MTSQLKIVKIYHFVTFGAACSTPDILRMNPLEQRSGRYLGQVIKVFDPNTPRVLHYEAKHSIVTAKI